MTLLAGQTIVGTAGAANINWISSGSSVNGRDCATFTATHLFTAAGAITRSFSFRCNSGGTGTATFKVLRDNGANYDIVYTSPSYLGPFTDNTTHTLTLPIGQEYTAVVGDILCIHGTGTWELDTSTVGTGEDGIRFTANTNISGTVSKSVFGGLIGFNNNFSADGDLPSGDIIAPVIILTGGSVNVIVGGTYTEPGFTATDNIDGDITANVVVGGTIDTNITGQYTLTYDVSDAALNPAVQQTRTVNVTANTDSITLDSIPAVHTRNQINDNITVNLSGTYVKSVVSSIRYRVRYADGAQEVVTGQDWTVLVASPTGNVFNQDVIIPTSRRTLQLDVDFSNDVLITDTTNSTNSIAHYLDCGDSLSLDMSTDGIATPVQGVFFRNISTGALSVPTVGQGDITCLNLLAVHLDCAVAMMNTGVGSTNLIQENGSPFLYSPGGTTPQYTNMLAAWTLAGNIEGVLLEISTNDAFNDLAAPSLYQTRLGEFFTEFRAATKVDLPFVVLTTGTHATASSDQNWTDYAIAHSTATETAALVYPVSVYGLELKDTTHPAPATYGKVGLLAGNALITEVYGGNLPYKPMRVSSVTSDGTNVSINLLLPETTGTDFTPVSAIRDIALSTDGTNFTTITDGSVVRLNANTITVPFANATHYRVNWGATPAGIFPSDTFVRDNSATANPLLRAQGTINVPDTTAPTITLVGGTVNIEQGTAYIEPGFSANDNIDGDITSSVIVTGTVDINTVGTYTLNYNVSDSSNNAAVQQQRTVNVTTPVTTTSTLSINVGNTSINGTYVTNLCNASTGVQVSQQSLLYTMGTATVVLDVTTGTNIKGYVDNGTDAVNEGTRIIGVTV